MNRRWIARCGLVLVATFSLASGALADCGPGDIIEEGRSPVPTVPMITYAEQRAMVARFPYEGAQAFQPQSPSDPQQGGDADNPSPTPTEAPASPAPKPDETPKPPDGGNYTPGSLTSQEQSLYEAINEEREKNGLAALPLDTELSALAREKSADMVANHYFAHESPTLGHASDMLDNAGYDYTSVGENIARSASVEKGHAALMSSTDHRRNILGSQWKRVGVGIVNDANGYPYITELFVR